MRKWLLLLSLSITAESFCQPTFKMAPLLTDSTVNLFAFVGRKISLIEFDPNKNLNDTVRIKIDTTTGDTLRQVIAYHLDNGFDAKYEIIVTVFNDLKCDTICFKAYDHYGRPEFENYQTVLLYISKYENSTSYFHQKYQFDPVRKRHDGKWVGKNGESLEELFNKKRETVFKARGLFKK